MTRKSVAPKRRTPTPPAPSPSVPLVSPLSPLASLSVDVEATCHAAAEAVRAAGRLVAGEGLGLNDDDGMPVLTARGLEALADELAAVAERALNARGGAA